jgi:hypothetical protein
MKPVTMNLSPLGRLCAGNLSKPEGVCSPL